VTLLHIDQFRGFSRQGELRALECFGYGTVVLAKVVDTVDSLSTVLARGNTCDSPMPFFLLLKVSVKKIDFFLLIYQ
jgi:hypothetical protein